MKVPTFLKFVSLLVGSTERKLREKVMGLSPKVTKLREIRNLEFRLPKKPPRTLAVILIVAVLAIFSFGNTDNTKYIEAQVSIGSVSNLVSGTGLFQNASDVFVPVFSQNPISAISVKVGDSVTAGQTLATLINVKEHLNLVNAKNALQIAQVQYANAQKALATTGNVVSATIAQLTTNLNAAIQLQRDDLPILQNAVTVAELNYNNELTNDAVKLLNYDNTVDLSLSDLNTAKVTSAAYTNLMGDEKQITTLMTTNSPGVLGQACAIFGLVGPACTSVDVTADYNTFEASFQKYNNAKLNYENSLRTRQLNLAGDQQGAHALKNALDLAKLNLQIASDRDAQAVQKAQDAITVYNAQTQLTQDPLGVVKATISNTKEALAAAEWAYNNTIIKSPVAGKVLSISGSVNAVPTPYLDQGGGNKTGLFVIGGIASSTFKATFPASLGSNLHYGDVLSITSTGFTAQATTKSTPSETFAGNVLSSIYIPARYGVAAHYEVEIAVAKPDASIFPGVSGTVSAPIALKKNVLIIPKDFISHSGGKTWALLKSKGNKKKYVPVSTGVEGSNTIEIVSGLKMGDTIMKIQK